MGTRKQDGPQRSKFERYDIQEIHRSELKNAPYNPRVISDKARRKLKKNLESVGLLAPIIWNKRTGNIVSGHQRISSLDALEKSYDYTLKVAVVDLDYATEKAQNIFMNNVDAQGDFDMDQLEGLLKSEEFDTSMAGFDKADIYKLFGTDAMSDDSLAEMSNSLHALRDGFDKIKAKSDERDNDDFYVVVVFRDTTHRNEFLAKIGEEEDRYLSGERLFELIEGGDGAK